MFSFEISIDVLVSGKNKTHNKIWLCVDRPMCILNGCQNTSIALHLYIPSPVNEKNYNKRKIKRRKRFPYKYDGTWVIMGMLSNMQCTREGKNWFSIDCSRFFSYFLCVAFSRFVFLVCPIPNILFSLWINKNCIQHFSVDTCGFCYYCCWFIFRAISLSSKRTDSFIIVFKRH